MARQMVYLVTFAALLGPGAQGGEGATLRDLESLSRAHIRDAVLDAVAHPERAMAVGRPRAGGLQVVKMAVFEEIHAHGGKHFHVALRLSSSTRWLGLKLALLKRSHLASHWSSSHTMFWSAVRYGAFATGKKPSVDDSPLTWTADGTPMNLYEEAQEPFNAAALKSRREKREREAPEVDGPLGPKQKQKVGHGRQTPRATFDVSLPGCRRHRRVSSCLTDCGPPAILHSDSVVQGLVPWGVVGSTRAGAQVQ